MEPTQPIKTLPRVAYHGARRLANSFRSVFERDEFGLNWRELIRLEYSPSFSHTTAPLLGKRIALTEPTWYLFCYYEIFKDEIYKFNTESPAPLIIDCGSNIGLSVIYFKHLYPNARIVAFEPDEDIFKVLQLNVENYELKDVSLHCAAIWNAETELLFQPDGGVGGRLWDGEGARKVKTARLRDHLVQHVDFLKVDIEGAELEVLRDCADLLKNVDYLFVEHHGLEESENSLAEILRILRAAGFRYHLKEAKPVKHPFLRAERNGYSLQLNIFAFRDSE